MSYTPASRRHGLTRFEPTAPGQERGQLRGAVASELHRTLGERLPGSHGHPLRFAPPDLARDLCAVPPPGLVGRFNEVVIEHAREALARLPGKAQVWAVGERIRGGVADSGLPLLGVFPVPGSVQAITGVVGQILVQSEAREHSGEDAELHLFYNRPTSGAAYGPVSQRLLPLDEAWRRALSAMPWPTAMLPEAMGDGTATLRAAAVALGGQCVRRLPRPRQDAAIESRAAASRRHVHAADRTRRRSSPSWCATAQTRTPRARRVGLLARGASAND